MSEDNLELVRQGYALFDRRHIFGILDLVDPAIE